MNTVYVVGMMCGLAIAVVAIWVFKKIFMKKVFNGETKSRYDERQLIEQGKAGKIGMYFLMVYGVIYGLVDLVWAPEVSPFIVMFAGMIITITLYAIICIWNEAYFPINQSIKKWLWIMTGIAVLNAVVAFTNSRGPVSMTEIVTTSVIVNILCVIMCMAVVVASIIKLNAMKSTENDDVEDER